MKPLFAMILMMTFGQTAFGATERDPAMAKSPSRGEADFQSVSTELRRDYQKLFKLLDESVEKLARSGGAPAADRRVSMATSGER